MTVHNESLNNPRVMEPLEDDSLGYAESRNESLALFGAALGGALLGMLLTLLVLAVINNGSLRFDTAAGSQRLVQVEDQVTVLDESIRNVNENVTIVGENLTGEVSTTRDQVNTIVEELDGQGVTLSQLGETIGSLENTRDEFDTFIAALSEAVATVNGGDSAGTADTATAGSAAESTATSANAGTANTGSAIASVVESSAQVPTSGVAVLAFADTNGNGLYDAGENAIEGLPVLLLDAEGQNVSPPASTGNAGLLFRNVPNGDYTVSISSGDADVLPGDLMGQVTVANEGDGQLIYFAVPVE